MNPTTRSRPWLHRTLTFVFALLSLVPAMLAQTTTGSITGRVMNAATSAYLEGAEVVVSANGRNTQARTLSNVNVFAEQRSRPLETVDINLQYYFSSRFSVFVDAINIHNRWQELYTGRDPNRVVISDSYGSRYNIGVAGRF
jgi:hypothetical protein